MYFVHMLYPFAPTMESAFVMSAPKYRAIITFCILAMHASGMAVEMLPSGMAVEAALFHAIIGLLVGSFAVVTLLVLSELDTVFVGVFTVTEPTFQGNALIPIGMPLSNVTDVTTG